MFKRMGWSLALILAAVWVVSTASAQTDLRAILSPVDISEFPNVVTYLDVRGTQGYFVPGLASNAVQVYEDEQPLVATITEVRNGAQVVFAFGGGESFNITTLGGATSRYDLIKNWLVDWARENTEGGLDDLSLVMPAAELVSHESDPQVWADTLQDYALTTSGTTSLEALSAAIDKALETTPKEGVGRAVVFFSDVLVENQIDAFQSLIDKAEQGGVRVNIGLIASPGLFQSDMAQVLQAGALQTGGQFFTFSSSETLPDLNMMIESSRRAYYLQYRSRVNTAGTHTVYVVVSTELGDVRSQTVSYESSLQAPMPVFVSPPTQVVRAVPEGEHADLANLAPDGMDLHIQVSFPDGIQRDIVHSSLYVNGELATENSEAPFDTFSLDLTPYQESAAVILQAEVTDDLGISGKSADISMDVVVQPPESGLFSAWGRNASFIAVGIVVLAGSVLLLVLVLAGRLRPRQIGERWRKRKAELDPVTQPVKLEDEITISQPEGGAGRTGRGLSARIPWQPRTRNAPVAYLVQVDEDGQVMPEGEYPIGGTEFTIGSDAGAALVLKDAAIEPVHTRIWRDSNGKFWVADMGSIAGTWLNYAPVSTSGSRLEHGDLVHVGKKGFRFSLSRPTRPRRTVVTPLEKAEDHRKVN